MCGAAVALASVGSIRVKQASEALGSSLAKPHALCYPLPMARPLRLELAGGIYHLTSRGDGRDDIYLSDADRIGWLDVLGEVCQRFNWVCHA